MPQSSGAPPHAQLESLLLPLPGGDDQRLGHHACGLRPGEDQGPGHLQQPAAEQEAQEGSSRGQRRLDGVSESVMLGGLMRSKESARILDLGMCFLPREGREQSESWTLHQHLVAINRCTLWWLIFFF